MAHSGFGGILDTPRTNFGDATYLGGQPDFADISQEATFISPAKQDNLVQQLRNGRANGAKIGTPRRRGLLGDRQNLPASIGGAEFTPLLKSATRNSARHIGKENETVAETPAALSRYADDDMTPLPRLDASIYSASRSRSFIDQKLPEIDASSTASTPIALPPRRGGDKGPLQDGNQLSLREQENVIDRIEKENFGLKLKIHFLEEALRKAGPGFSEAALKENTELKVDKVTMQRELQKYKKHLTTAEKDLENFRQQMLELQDKAKQKHADGSQKAELEKLQQALEDREADIENLQKQLRQGQKDKGQLEVLQDNVMDLEAELRDKDRAITERDDEVEDLREKLDEAENRIKELDERVADQETAAQTKEELDEAKDTIEELERKIRGLEKESSDVKRRMEGAIAEKDRADRDLEELDEAKDTIRELQQKIRGLEKDGIEVKRKMEEAIAERDRADGDLEELDEARDMIRGLQQKIRGLEKEGGDVKRKMEEAVADRERAGRDLEELDEAKEVIQEMQQKMRGLEKETSDVKRKMEKATADKDRAERDLEELQEELANKSIATKGLSRQIEEKVVRLQDELDRSNQEYATLEKDVAQANRENQDLRTTINSMRREQGGAEREQHLFTVKIQELETELLAQADAKDLLQCRHDAVEKDIARMNRENQELRTTLNNLRREQGGVEREHHLSAAKIQELEAELLAQADTKDLLQSRHDALTNESRSLQQEIRRLERENQGLEKSVAEERQYAVEVEKELRGQYEDEMQRLNNLMDKAAEDENRLKQEVLELQSKLRLLSSSETQDMASARRTIRELERRVEDLRAQLATAQTLDNVEGNSELSTMRRDLSTARQKEIDLVQRETSQKEVIKGLRRQVSELERQMHDKEVSRLNISVRSSPGGKEEELTGLREQLLSAQQSVQELRAKGREAERKAMQTTADLKRQLAEMEDQKLVLEEVLEEARQQAEDAAAEQRHTLQRMEQRLERAERDREGGLAATTQTTSELRRQLAEMEDQKLVLEEVLEEARQQAEEAAAAHEQTLQRLKQKLSRAERERDAMAAVATQTETETQGQSKRLRRSQTEISNLEHDVVQQQELIDGLAASEAALRRKLERARSERAAYRVSAEKLQRDMQRVRAELEAEAAEKENQRPGSGASEALETVVRAAQGAEERHKKELRGLVLQMGWMQRRWEREASLRSDAAYAKKFVQLQLDMANACNNAQLRELEHIRSSLLQSRKSQPSAVKSSGIKTLAAKSSMNLKSFLIMARFIARMRITSREWAAQEAIRKKLVVAVEETKKVKRSRLFKVVRAEC